MSYKNDPTTCYKKEFALNSDNGRKSLNNLMKNTPIRYEQKPYAGQYANKKPPQPSTGQQVTKRYEPKNNSSHQVNKKGEPKPSTSAQDAGDWDDEDYPNKSAVKKNFKR